MCKTTWVCIHALAIASLGMAAYYIVLNETGKLEKVKRKCYNKFMDMKEDFVKKMK